ncbi:MAG: phosphomannomutase [uncultured bacterium]|nr:MAG: phosphomannomutase [uncultured bacterium]
MFLLIARELIKKYPGAAFVHDLLFTKAFGDQIKELGGVAYESKVGHAFVKNRIRETGAIAGAEFSTHFNFKENYGAESSEYAALLALKILKESGKKLSELVLDLKKYYHSGVINFHAHEKDRIMADMKTVYSAQARKVSDLDGYKFTFDDWWFCVRPSNTEPVLRLVVEADTENLLDEKLAELQEFIHSRT